VRVPYGFDEPVKGEEFGDIDMDDPRNQDQFEAFKRNLKHKVQIGAIPPTSRYIYVKVFKLKMGKGNLLLLDTDIPENQDPEDLNDDKSFDRYIHPEAAKAEFRKLNQYDYYQYDPAHDRKIFDRIYPKDRAGADSQRMRFKQFVNLSLGSFKAFKLANQKRGIEIPTFLHLNDPHTAPAAAKVLVDPRYQDVLVTYTNHTLVKGAGTQRFDLAKLQEIQPDNDWLNPVFWIPFGKIPLIKAAFQVEETSVEFSKAAEILVAQYIRYGRVNAVNSDEHAVKLRQRKPKLYTDLNLVGVDNGVDFTWAEKILKVDWENLSPEEVKELIRELVQALKPEEVRSAKQEAKKELVEFINERYQPWLDKHFNGVNPIDPNKMLMVFATRMRIIGSMQMSFTVKV